MPHTPLRDAFRRPWPSTRRGLCLWLFSLAFILIGGVNYITSPQPETTTASLAFVLQLQPSEFWGWIMVSVGALAAWASYCHFGRDRYGFILLATFCAAWALVYLCGFLFYGAGLRAVSGSVIWVLFSGILSLISGFPNVSLKSPPLLADVEPRSSDG